jgi:N-acyl-D-aspartate/D-glutamate deacylase
MLRTLLPLLFLLSSLSAAEPATILRNATIHDGTGKAGYLGDLHFQGEKIVAVGKVGEIAGAKEIDCKGLVVCPGFIDLHTHCDDGLLGKVGKANKNYIMQGCTLVITGNCGSGPSDVGEYFKKLEAGGIGSNEIHLAPHNSIREKVMGNSNRAPTTEEQAKMEAMVEAAMKDGAFGMATGLIYNPGTYSKTEEIIGLAKVVGKHDGLYASHIRNEGSGLLTAIEEAIRIGKEGGCRVHISHIKASGKSAWGSSAAAVALIEKTQKSGQLVTADQYPYIASSTSLRATLVPSKYREGTQKDLVARMDDPKTGPQMKAEIEKAMSGGDGPKRIQIARYAKNPAWQGKNIQAIAEMEKKEPIDIVMEIERNGGAQVVNFGMSEEDVRVYMKRPWVATASDGGVQSPGATVPHPRSYGTFSRKIGRYAIEDGIITLEEAIHSATGLPASILKLTDRGTLKAGNFADIVVFDPKTFRDTATFDKPHQYPTGVKYVFVNGSAAVNDGKHDPAILGGKVLRHK